jgi:hypothetical protein
MQVRIYKPTKTSTQSGDRSAKWVLEFVTTKESCFIEPLMGRTASKDMRNEIRIEFISKEHAIRFAENNNYKFEVINLKERKLIKKSYASNFK